MAVGGRLCQGRLAGAILGQMRQDEGENALTVRCAVNGVKDLVRDFVKKVPLDLGVAVDASIVTEEEASALEGVAVGLADARPSRSRSDMSNHAVALRRHADLSQIDIVPGRLRVLEDGGPDLLVRLDATAAIVREHGNVGMVPAHAEAVAVHGVVVHVAELGMEGRILCQLDQRVARGQHNVRQGDGI